MEKAKKAMLAHATFVLLRRKSKLDIPRSANSQFGSVFCCHNKKVDRYTPAISCY